MFLERSSSIPLTNILRSPQYKAKVDREAVDGYRLGQHCDPSLLAQALTRPTRVGRG